MPESVVGNRGARWLFIAACGMIVIAGLREGATVILPFLIAFFLAIISLPLLFWLQKKKLPLWAAVIATILAMCLVLFIIGLMVSGSIDGFAERVPDYQKKIGNKWKEFQELLPSKVSKALKKLNVEDIVDPGAVMGFVGTAISSATGILSDFALVLLTLVFLLMEAGVFRQKLTYAFGESATMEKVTEEIQTYFGIKTVLSVATGVLWALWCWILGIDFPILWGLVAFVLNYIPNIGSIMAAIPTLLLALIQYGFGSAILVIVGNVAINTVLGNIIEPMMMGKRLGLSTLVVFLSLIFWGWLWGPIGMLLSVPLTMFAKILFEHTEDLKWIAALLAAEPERPKDAGPEPA